MSNNKLHMEDNAMPQTPLTSLIAALQRHYATDHTGIEAMLRGALDLAAYLTDRTNDRLEESDGYLSLPSQTKLDVGASAFMRSGLLFGILLERHRSNSKSQKRTRNG